MQKINLIFFLSIFCFFQSEKSALAQSPCPLIQQSFPVNGLKQKKATPLDILMVIDNSASMNPYQVALTEQIEAITSELNNVGLDFNIAITTTDSKVSITGLSFPKLNSEFSVKNVDEFRKLFLKTAKVGINGSSKEAGLDAIKNFLHAEGTSFLRPNAQFLILTLSDTDDPEHSVITPSELHALLLKYKNQNQVYVFNFIGNHGDHYTQFKNLFQGRDFSVLTTPYLREARLNQKKGEKFLQAEFGQLAQGITQAIPRDFQFKLNVIPDPASSELKISLKSRKFLQSEKFSLDKEGNLLLTLLLDGSDEVRITYQPLCPKEIPKYLAPLSSQSKHDVDPSDVTSENVLNSVEKAIDDILGKLHDYANEKEDQVNQKIPDVQSLSAAKQKKFILEQYRDLKKGERPLRTELSKEFINLLDQQAQLNALDEKIFALEKIHGQESINLEDPIAVVKSLDQRIRNETKPFYIILDTSGSMSDYLQSLSGEMIALLQKLEPKQQFNVASVTSQGVKKMHESPVSWSNAEKAAIHHFIDSTQDGGSYISAAISDAVNSGYGTIIVISDSMLFDEPEFIFKSKSIGIPIYSLITFNLDGRFQSIEGYQRAYIEKVVRERSRLKRELTAIKLAKNKKEMGEDLNAEAQKVRSMLIYNNRVGSFAEVEIQVFAEAAKMTPDEIDQRIAKIEVGIAQLDNTLSPKRYENSLLNGGRTTPGCTLYFSLASASCNSGGAAMMINPYDAIFTIDREKELFQKMKEENQLFSDSVDDEAKIKILKEQRQSLLKQMTGTLKSINTMQ